MTVSVESITKETLTTIVENFSFILQMIFDDEGSHIECVFT